MARSRQSPLCTIFLFVDVSLAPLAFDSKNLEEILDPMVLVFFQVSQLRVLSRRHKQPRRRGSEPPHTSLPHFCAILSTLDGYSQDASLDRTPLHAVLCRNDRTHRRNESQLNKLVAQFKSWLSLTFVAAASVGFSCILAARRSASTCFR